jgi:hypothetical protein
MTLTLELPPNLEALLKQTAEQQGVRPEEFALETLKRSLSSSPQGEAIDLIQSWIDEGDEEEQRETLEVLKNGLNVNRFSSRLIFPDDETIP